VTEAVVPGTVLAPGIWWAKFSPDGRNINQITPQDESDMGAGALFYDTLVTVTPIAQTGPIERQSQQREAQHDLRHHDLRHHDLVRPETIARP
jgi:hypothetical protein